ncbi:MAG: hypothetical protein ACMUJM_12455 [bacterium]
MDQFKGYHSEWNLGSPGGWDYQRITQNISKTIWGKYFQGRCAHIDIDFDHPLLIPVHGFITMLKEAHYALEGRNGGLIAVVAEEETLDDVVENKNLAVRLNALDGLSSALMAPHELELNNGRVCWRGQPVSLIFMDFNTDVLLNLHRKYKLDPLLQAVREKRVINPRGTEPINSKSMFEVITNPQKSGFFHKETVRRTPWTRQFYHRKTIGPKGEDIADLIEYTRSHWEKLVLKPERGYSGKGVKVGGIHHDVDDYIEMALKQRDYIVQEKIPLTLWGERIPELVMENHTVTEALYQTDFRCLFGQNGLFGFLGRYGHVPTNVGSGGGVQPLAVLKSNLSVGEATQHINNSFLGINFEEILHAFEDQKKMAMDNQFTYLLGPIKIALRPRLITTAQMEALETYCAGIWADCLTMEKMWHESTLDVIINIDPEELEIIKSQPWGGGPAIFASDGLFSFGAHIK